MSMFSSGSLLNIIDVEDVKALSDLGLPLASSVISKVASLLKATPEDVLRLEGVPKAIFEVSKPTCLPACYYYSCAN